MEIFGHAPSGYDEVKKALARLAYRDSLRASGHPALQCLRRRGSANRKVGCADLLKLGGFAAKRVSPFQSTRDSEGQSATAVG